MTKFRKVTEESFIKNDPPIELLDNSISSQRREFLRIIVDILEITNSPASKTNIVYKANLNFKRVERYLDYMLKFGLINMINNSARRKYYVVTDKGRNFLSNYKKLIKQLEKPS
jgi:predicted transcriptional regulator